MVDRPVENQVKPNPLAPLLRKYEPTLKQDLIDVSKVTVPVIGAFASAKLTLASLASGDIAGSSVWGTFAAANLGAELNYLRSFRRRNEYNQELGKQISARLAMLDRTEKLAKQAGVMDRGRIPFKAVKNTLESALYSRMHPRDKLKFIKEALLAYHQIGDLTDDQLYQGLKLMDLDDPGRSAERLHKDFVQKFFE